MTSRTSLLISLFSLGLWASEAAAQWSEIAPNAVAGVHPAIHFSDGIVWVADKSVEYSMDSGKTWQAATSPSMQVYRLLRQEHRGDRRRWRYHAHDGSWNDVEQR